MAGPQATEPHTPAGGPDAAAGWRGRLGKAAILFLAFVGLIVIGLRLVVFALYSIPSSAMYPTVLVGDYLAVSKYSYGYGRYSVPFMPADLEGRLWESPVERGDVAVFRNPMNPSEDYIKRIVGLPGERIQVKAGILHINGEPVGRRQIEDFKLGPGRVARQYLETLPNGRVHRIVEQRGDDSRFDNTREFIVPPGHYFGMGDNRDNSADSRVIGFIPAENLIGRAEVVLLSHDGFRMRVERMFHGIE
jgi:signal peptidase I